MEIKKKTLVMVTAVFVLILFGAISTFAASGSTIQKTLTGKVVNNGEVQNVKLTFENYEYVMEPKTLKQGIPVRMEVDLNTVTGCMRDIVIGAFNVKKYVREGDNIVEFTPDKAGTFWIVCSMNMGRGQFSVAENDGVIPAYVEQQSASAGSCGGSGGCGCGS